MKKIFYYGIRISAILLLLYAFFYGLTAKLPSPGGNLAQTARNLFYHVPMWFTMYLMFGISLFWSVKYLMLPEDKFDYTRSYDFDAKAETAARMGIFFGVLGLITGIFWSRVTWGENLPDSDFSAWWPWDPKQTLALVALFIYFAYFILRANIKQFNARAKVSAVYNVFAAASVIPLTFVIPRMLDSLHPGSKETGPLISSEAISNEYRLIFYPAIIGFMALALWIWSLHLKLKRLEYEKEN